MPEAQSITARCFARAGLVGNPSDGFFGKTLSFTVRNFSASVTLVESNHFEVIPGASDLCRFGSVSEFLQDQRLHGYYGSMRLIKSAVKRFHDYASEHQLSTKTNNYTLSLQTTIPRLVGLSGSSAIVIATLRALMEFHRVQIARHWLPTLAIECERDELRLPGGLQDRVIQVYEGMVFMDFDRALIEARGYGNYEPLRPNAMPLLYLAYDPERAEISEVVHRNLRELYDRGDANVVDTMGELRKLTDRGREALLAGDWGALGEIVDENFELRKRIVQIAPENQRMIDTARSTGASAHFAGSGGAICGLYRDEAHFCELARVLAAIRCRVIKPVIFES